MPRRLLGAVAGIATALILVGTGSIAAAADTQPDPTTATENDTHWLLPVAPTPTDPPITPADTHW